MKHKIGSHVMEMEAAKKNIPIKRKAREVAHKAGLTKYSEKEKREAHAHMKKHGG